MKSILFNKDWKFWLDKNSFSMMWNIPEHAKTITLPHDAMLEAVPYANSPNGGKTGFRDGEVYQYVKILHLDETVRNQTYLLKFEGIYMNAMVYVNGNLAAKCPYGYTGFYVELNDYLNYGEDNEIRVFVRNSGMTNSRWYSGGGVYRDVYLFTGGEVYLEPEGVQVTTETLDLPIHPDVSVSDDAAAKQEGSATLKITAAIRNRSTQRYPLRLVTQIFDANNQLAAADSCPLTIFQHSSRTMTRRVTVPAPHAWTADTPYLYRCVTQIYENDCLLDESCETFGIRTLHADAVHGLRVNVRTVKLRGACIHHDGGLLGAATFYDAECRRVRILKDAGFNAIRMSHHPAAPALLRACDELGMYVMDECFDMWTRCKSDNDYGLFFSEWWEKDVEAMVRKDYNHPSVILYSAGNEISENGYDHGSLVCQQISDKLHALDSTRFTLTSVNGLFSAGNDMPRIMSDVIRQAEEEKRAAGIDTSAAEGTVNDFMSQMDANIDRIVMHEAVTQKLDMAFSGVDIAGYNYMTARYEPDHTSYPNRVIVGSETYPPEIARNWEIISRLDNVIGDFTWTGWDYLGEAGVGVPAYAPGEGGFHADFPCQLAYVGDIDITGFRRPTSYFREIVFGLRKAPYITVQNPYRYGQPLRKTPWVISDSVSSWTYPGMEHKPVIIEIYSSGTEVELFCNGTSLGKKPCGAATGYISHFETTYQPGILEAVSYDGETELGRMTLQTAEQNVHLTAEVQQISKESPESEELIYISIASCDEQGLVNTASSDLISFHAEGVMQAWFGSGNPKPDYHYLGNETTLWNGRALLILRKKPEGGTIQVTLSSSAETLHLEL